MKIKENHEWIREFPGAITVCDETGIILEMNKKAEEVFKEDGGKALVGKNALDCHPEPSRSKMTELLESHQPNIYTIEKKGKKKLIYQAPWLKDGKFGGIVELSLELPNEIPHHIREG
jgi:transcriptional regulator with PAS, ATPase and Fis domain